MTVKVARELSRDDWLPVSVARLITQLRAYPEDYPEGSAEKAMLEAQIHAATRWLEKRLGRAIVGATVELAMDGFPAGAIELRQFPVRRLVSIKYMDQAGEEQEIPAEEVQQDFSSLRGRLNRAGGWPASAAGFNTVRIVLEVGCGEPEEIPHDLQLSILMLAAHFHENGSATTPVKLHEVPNGALALADPYGLEAI